MSAEDRVRIVCAGDLMFSPRMLAPRHNDREPEHYFGAVRSVFEGGDIVFCNLESALFREGRPSRLKTSPRLYSPPERILAILKYLGVDVVCLGNNHIDDFGDVSLVKTRQLLQEQGFAVFGAGADRKEARQPLIVDKNGVKVGFLGYTTRKIGATMATDEVGGCNPYALETIGEDLRQIRDEVDVAVVSLHWGHEFFHYPSPAQIQLAHRIVEAGADVIAGHHPHCIQGVERYEHGAIFYSLGNFFLYNFLLRLGYPVYCNDFMLAICDVAGGGVKADVALGTMDRDNRLGIVPDNHPLHAEFRRYCDRLADVEYESFWRQYERDIRCELQQTVRDHAWKVIRSPRDIENILTKIRMFGWRHLIGRATGRILRQKNIRR